MIRLEYDLAARGYTVKGLLWGKRAWRGFKFKPTQSKRDWFIASRKRIREWNKHTMGTE